MKKIKYKIYSLGCKVNQYDAGALGGGLASSGFKMVGKSADLAVVYSCAVTGGAISKSRRAVNRAKRENPRAKIILTGCWPKTYREDAERSRVADLVLAKGSLEDILCAARDLYGFASHSSCGQMS